jgi:SAM-dependent methyltransferase
MNSYGRLSTAFYDRDKPAAPPDAVAYYLARARGSNGPVLEPMCGSGRFLLPLLQAGVALEGVDASPEMLAACRCRADALGLTATLYEQPLESLSLPRRYGLAFVPAGSLGLIHPRASLRACLRALRRHLGPGATLLVELLDKAAYEADANDSGARFVDADIGRKIHYEWQATHDRSSGTVRFDGRYRLRDGEKLLAEESEEIVLTLYSSAEVADELHLAGFSGAHAVPATTGMSWLQESGCSLYECTVPSNNSETHATSAQSP